MEKGFVGIGLLGVGLLCLGGVGCGQKEAPKPPETAPLVQQSAPSTLTPPARTGATLFLAQAQFVEVKREDGRATQAPGDARLLIFTRGEAQWTEDVIEDPDSNVFHKAAWFTPAEGEPGILTIGAMKAHLKLWRNIDGKWTGESLWQPTFGGKYDRLRDFEIGDVTGDKIDDIVIATHDQGVVAVVSWRDGRYQAEELVREEETFVHEVELGDINGDGVLEIFTTPSHPNKMDGSVQPGSIDMFSRRDGKWTQKRVDTLESRHAKEILTFKLPGEEHMVLLASLEGENIGGDTKGGDTTRIRLYRVSDSEISQEDVVGLPGKLCRFLTAGDTDGDGRREIVAFTKSSGIWKIDPPAVGKDGVWKKRLIATGSSGYEHSAYLSDLNGDGKDEIYVASDDQKELRCYWYDGVGYSYDVLSSLKQRTITWNITVR